MECEIFFSPKKKKYYFNNIFKKCHGCNEIIEDLIIIKSIPSLKKTTLLHFCSNCFKKTKIHSQITQSFFCIVSKVLPKDSYPIFNFKITLKPSTINNNEISCFESHKIETETTIDKTKFAGRESLEGAKIGVNINKVIEEKDKGLKGDEGIKLLDNIKNSVPAIDYNKRRLLK